LTAGLLDTSVVIGWDDPEVAGGLPDEASVCVVTVAELAAGPHLTTDLAERARRQALLQQVESLFDPIPVDVAVCRSYGQVVAAVVGAGRKPRGRFADLLIAAIAHANNLGLYTRNPDDFRGLEGLIRVNAL